MTIGRAHIYKVLQASDGTVVTGATIRVLGDGTGTEISDTLFAGETGPDAIDQGFVSDTGLVEFYLTIPKRIIIGYTPPGGGSSEEYVTADANPMAGDIVVAAGGLTITNPVATSGKVLEANGDGTATFQVNSGGGGGGALDIQVNDDDIGSESILNLLGLGVSGVDNTDDGSVDITIRPAQTGPGLPPLASVGPGELAYSEDVNTLYISDGDPGENVVCDFGAYPDNTQVDGATFGPSDEFTWSGTNIETNGTTGFVTADAGAAESFPFAGIEDANIECSLNLISGWSPSNNPVVFAKASASAPADAAYYVQMIGTVHDSHHVVELTLFRQDEQVAQNFSGAMPLIGDDLDSFGEATLVLSINTDGTITASVPEMGASLTWVDPDPLTLGGNDICGFQIGIFSGVHSFSVLNGGTLRWAPVGGPLYLETILSGSMSVGDNLIPPGIRVPINTVLREVHLVLNTPPSGAADDFTLTRASDSSVLATISIADGEATADLTDLAVAIAVGDRILVNCSATGTDDPGEDLAVAVVCY